VFRDETLAKTTSRWWGQERTSRRREVVKVRATHPASMQRMELEADPLGDRLALAVAWILAEGPPVAEFPRRAVDRVPDSVTILIVRLKEAESVKVV